MSETQLPLIMRCQLCGTSEIILKEYPGEQRKYYFICSGCGLEASGYSPIEAAQGWNRQARRIQMADRTDFHRKDEPQEWFKIYMHKTNHVLNLKGGEA